jgi:hypothetical protein
MLGVELHDTRAVAVAVNGAGEVLARSVAEASADLIGAAQTAIKHVRQSASDPRDVTLGVACVAPESSMCTATAGALAREYDGAPDHGAATASGVAAAVAEAWVGAAKGVEDVVYFASDEHTTAGIVRAGAPLTGARGRAASVAWLALNPVEREDYRRVGCLEAEVSAAGIVRRFVWRIKSGDASRVQEQVANDLAKVTVAHILTAARERDGVAISVVRDTAKYLGMAAANLVVVTDPQMLVLGGIITGEGDLLLELVRAEIARRLPRAMLDALAIVPAALGAEAPAIGAARLAGAAAR